MKPHKRNGKAAKQRRQYRARIRKNSLDQFIKFYASLTYEEQAVINIFGNYVACVNCRKMKLFGAKCYTDICYESHLDPVDSELIEKSQKYKEERIIRDGRNSLGRIFVTESTQI